MAEEYIEGILAEPEKERILAQGPAEYEQRLDIKMLLHNKIPGVLSLRVSYIDNQVLYCYSCDGMISLEQILSDRALDFRTAYRLVEDICSGHRIAKDFFLKEEHFLIHPSYLMWHPLEEKFFICYFPGWKSELPVQIEKLWEELLPKVDHKEDKSVVFCYDFYNMLRQVNVNMGEIERYLQKNHEESVEEQIRKETVENKTKKPSPREKRGYCLERVSPCTQAPEKISLEEERILIGRREGVGNISGRQISRNHARLEWENGQLYLTDTDSRNGVRLNGKSLIRNRSVLCREGDTITFADISYRVRKQ